MTFKEYVKYILIIIPIFIGIVLAALAITYLIHIPAIQYTACMFFSIIYIYFMIKYLEFMADKFLDK